MKRRRLSSLLLPLAVVVLLVLRYAFDISWAARAAGALLIATLVIRWGYASLRPMRVGTKNFDPVDVVEPGGGLPVYACAGCGTQLVLLRKGNDKAPRHCGEPMRYDVISPDASESALDLPSQELA